MVGHFQIVLPQRHNIRTLLLIIAMDLLVSSLQARHIQDHDAANTTEEQHWGYPSRVVPCTNDPGSCEYLKGVYWMHDVSMLYTFILWGVILGILAVWVTIRGWRMGGPSQSVGSAFDKICDLEYFPF